jgi:hypothetical protein
VNSVLPIVAVCLLTLGLVVDSLYTIRGLHAGVAYEARVLVRTSIKLFGVVGGVCFYGVLEWSAIALPALLLPTSSLTAACFKYLFIGGCAGLGVGHLYGSYQWSRLLR